MTSASGFQSTPPARGATTASGNQMIRIRFQSTPPARGATADVLVRRGKALYFNPRPPRGGRPGLRQKRSPSAPISIHAPREGGDSFPPSAVFSPVAFQSTPPREGGDHRRVHPLALRILQSTPPREGGDALPLPIVDRLRTSIHAPPRGGRPASYQAQKQY